MRRTSALLLLLVLLLGWGISQAHAANPDAMRLRVTDARVAAAPAGGSSAIGMLLTNPTSGSLVITGAATPLAGQTILQTYVTSGSGLVQITPVDRLPVPPGTEVLLAPGVTELQLVGLTTDLEPGLELPLTLIFADGTRRTIRITVQTP